MVTLIVCAFVVLQQLQVDAVVDRTTADVGDDISLTITVEAAGNNPVQIFNPSLTGLELLGTTDQSDVSIREGVATRVLTRVLRLRAASTGEARIGPVTVRLGASVAQTDAIELFVATSTDEGVKSLAPHVIRMIEQHTPTGLSNESVHVEVLTSTDSLMLGDQLDLAVVAWFPDQVRDRLRTPPTLQPPELQGAWTYSRGIPHAVQMSRRLQDTRYRVYVHSTVVFPLTPGELEIGPATVSYSLPMSYSFLSREIRHEPQSTPTTVRVSEQPTASRPPDFEGAAGSGLTLALGAAATELEVGEATLVTAVLEGEGNVALWPEPTIHWPAAVRAYPEDVEVTLDADAERISGSKTFEYLVIADSAGQISIEDVRYPYFDLRAQRYELLLPPELTIVAEARANVVATDARADSRALMTKREVALSAALMDVLASWVWLLIAGIPPILAIAARLLPRLEGKRSAARRETGGQLDRVRQEFDRVLIEAVGSAACARSTELVAALRAAGIEAPIAAHTARVRERLWQANFGPESELDPDELAAEVGEVLRALKKIVTTPAIHLAVRAVALCVYLSAATSQVTAQSPERLYEAGAFPTAADSFAARAVAEPLNVAHWYNLGAAYERAGDVERARYAWIRSARLAPRDGRITSALRELPGQDAASARLTRVRPVTPAEAFLLASVLWIGAWACFSFRVNRFVTTLIFAAALSFGAYGWGVMAEYRSSVAIVVADEVPLREAPYGPAPAAQLLEAGIAVEVARSNGEWHLVERLGEMGWLLNDEVVPLQ